MAFKNRTTTYAFHHPEWAEDSYWTFRTEMSRDDRDAIQALTTRTVIGELDQKLVKERLKQGLDIRDLVRGAVSQVSEMSVMKATLLQMSVSWEGKEFIPDEDFKVRNQATGKWEVHAQAGELAPLDEVMIGAFDPDQTDDVMTALNQVWAGRSPEELKTFPGDGVRASVSGNGRPATGVDHEAAGDRPVPITAAGARRGRATAGAN